MSKKYESEPLDQTAEGVDELEEDEEMSPKKQQPHNADAAKYQPTLAAKTPPVLHSAEDPEHMIGQKGDTEVFVDNGHILTLPPAVGNGSPVTSTTTKVIPKTKGRTRATSMKAKNDLLHNPHSQTMPNLHSHGATPILPARVASPKLYSSPKKRFLSPDSEGEDPNNDMCLEVDVGMEASPTGFPDHFYIIPKGKGGERHRQMVKFLKNVDEEGRQLSKYEVDKKGQFKSVDGAGDENYIYLPCFSPNGQDIIGYKWEWSKPKKMESPTSFQQAAEKLSPQVAPVEDQTKTAYYSPQQGTVVPGGGQLFVPKMSEQKKKRVLFSLNAATDCRPHIWLTHQMRGAPARMRIFHDVSELKTFAHYLSLRQAEIAELSEEEPQQKLRRPSDPPQGPRQTGPESKLDKKHGTPLAPVESQKPARPTIQMPGATSTTSTAKKMATAEDNPFGTHISPTGTFKSPTFSLGKRGDPHRSHFSKKKAKKHHHHHHHRHHSKGKPGASTNDDPLVSGIISTTTSTTSTPTTSSTLSSRSSGSGSPSGSLTSGSSHTSTDAEEINETFWLDIQSFNAETVKEMLSLFPMRDNTVERILVPEVLDNIEMYSAENYMTFNVVCKSVAKAQLTHEEVHTEGQPDPKKQYRPQHYMNFLREAGRVVCSVVLYEDWVITLHSMPFQGLSELIRRIQDVYGIKKHRAHVSSGHSAAGMIASQRLSSRALQEHIQRLSESENEEDHRDQRRHSKQQRSDVMSALGSVFGEKHKARPDVLVTQFLTTTWVCATLMNFTTECILPDPSSLLAEADRVDEDALQIKADQREILQKIAQLRRSLSNQQSTILRKEKLIVSFQTPEMRSCFVSKLKTVREIYTHTLSQISFVSERLNVAREVLSHANANFASNVSLQMSQDGNEMNKKMQALSQVASVCLPLSIITGAFGMNVTVPYQTNKYPNTVAPFFIVCSIMVLWLLITSPAIWWSTRKQDEEDPTNNVVMDGSDLV